MILNIPALAIPAIILLIGVGVVLYARWDAAHDRSVSTPATDATTDKK